MKINKPYFFVEENIKRPEIIQINYPMDLLYRIKITQYENDNDSLKETLNIVLKKIN